MSKIKGTIYEKIKDFRANFLNYPPKISEYASLPNLEDEFCDRFDCHDCKGTDMNGEPMGYGCDHLEQWIEKYGIWYDFLSFIIKDLHGRTEIEIEKIYQIIEALETNDDIDKVLKYIKDQEEK